MRTHQAAQVGLRRLTRILRTWVRGMDADAEILRRLDHRCAIAQLGEHRLLGLASVGKPVRRNTGPGRRCRRILEHQSRRRGAVAVAIHRQHRHVDARAFAAERLIASQAGGRRLPRSDAARHGRFGVRRRPRLRSIRPRRACNCMRAARVACNRRQSRSTIATPNASSSNRLARACVAILVPAEPSDAAGTSARVVAIPGQVCQRSMFAFFRPIHIHNEHGGKD